MRGVRTGEKVGRFYVYALGDWRWYRAEGGPVRTPEWFLWNTDDTRKWASNNGEFVDVNPERIRWVSG